MDMDKDKPNDDDGVVINEATASPPSNTNKNETSIVTTENENDSNPELSPTIGLEKDDFSDEPVQTNNKFCLDQLCLPMTDLISPTKENNEALPQPSQPSSPKSPKSLPSVNAWSLSLQQDITRNEGPDTIPIYTGPSEEFSNYSSNNIETVVVDDNNILPNVSLDKLLDSPNNNDNDENGESKDDTKKNKKKTLEEELGVVKPSIAKLISLAEKEMPVIICTTIVMAIVESTKLTIPLIIGKAYDGLVNPDFDDKEKLQEVARFMSYAILVHGVTTSIGCIRSYILGVAGQRIVARVRNDLYERLLKQEISFFDGHAVGDLISRLGSDTTLLQATISRQISSLILGLIRIVACVGLMFWISIKLASANVGLVLVVLAIVIPFSRWVRKVTTEYLAALGKSQACSAETLGAMRTVQAFVAEKREMERYSIHIGDPDDTNCLWWPSRSSSSTPNTYSIGCILSIAAAAMEGVMVGLGFIAMFGILWFGFILVIDGEITLGSLTAFQAYIFQVGFGLGAVAGSITQIASAWGAAGRIFYILDREPLIGSNAHKCNNSTTDTSTMNSDMKDGTHKMKDDHNNNNDVDVENGIVSNNVAGEGVIDIPATNTTTTTITKIDSIKGDIDFEGVTFSYPSRPMNPVLIDFNLSVPSNTTTALVGSSGAGKSTVVSLLQRFYEINKGKISIDGHDIQNLDLGWWRRQIGYVQQEPQLFGLTIKENLLYGVENGNDVSQEELDDICKQANAYDFIHEFPDGYDTMVGERGVQLSGGQKQRLAIGRALLTKCRILLLDEATSALDAESEHLVQEAIDKAVKGRTVIIIAHRLSTVQRANQIVVMKDHQIVGIGSHKALLCSCPTYQELIYRQSVMQLSEDEKEDLLQHSREGATPVHDC